MTSLNGISAIISSLGMLWGPLYIVVIGLFEPSLTNLRVVPVSS